jgi:hypothetical protein
MAVTSFVTLLLTALYLAAVATWLRFSSHEFLVCREVHSASACEKKFKSDLSSFWRFGKWNRFQTHRSNSEQILEIHLELEVLSLELISWNYQDKIQLPLKF